jgi:hypothetical protein
MSLDDPDVGRILPARIHQAEGMLSARYGLSVEDAAEMINVRAAELGWDQLAMALQITESRT